MFEQPDLKRQEASQSSGNPNSKGLRHFSFSQPSETNETIPQSGSQNYTILLRARDSTDQFSTDGILQPFKFPQIELNYCKRQSENKNTGNKIDRFQPNNHKLRTNSAGANLREGINGSKINERQFFSEEDGSESKLKNSECLTLPSDGYPQIFLTPSEGIDSKPKPIKNVFLVSLDNAVLEQSREDQSHSEEYNMYDGENSDERSHQMENSLKFSEEEFQPSGSQMKCKQQTSQSNKSEKSNESPLLKSPENHNGFEFSGTAIKVKAGDTTEVVQAFVVHSFRNPSTVFVNDPIEGHETQNGQSDMTNLKTGLDKTDEENDIESPSFDWRILGDPLKRPPLPQSLGVPNPQAFHLASISSPLSNIKSTTFPRINVEKILKGLESYQTQIRGDETHIEFQKMTSFACILRANGRLSALLDTRSLIWQKIALDRLKRFTSLHSYFFNLSPGKELVYRVHQIMLKSFFIDFRSRISRDLTMKTRFFSMAQRLLKRHIIRSFKIFSKRSTKKRPILRPIKIFITTIENIMRMRLLDSLMLLFKNTGNRVIPRVSITEKRSSKGSNNRYETVAKSIKNNAENHLSKINGTNIPCVDNRINEWRDRQSTLLELPSNNNNMAEKNVRSAGSVVDDDTYIDLRLLLNTNKLIKFQSSASNGITIKSPNYKSDQAQKHTHKNFFFKSSKAKDLKSSSRFQTNPEMNEKFDSNSKLNAQMYGTNSKPDNGNFLNLPSHHSNPNSRISSCTSTSSMVVSAVVAIVRMITDHLYNICQSSTPKTKQLEDTILSKLEEILIFVHQASPSQLSQNASAIYGLLEQLYAILRDIDAEDDQNFDRSKYSTLSRLNTSANNLIKISQKDLVLNRYKGGKTSTDLPLNEATKNLPIKVKDLERNQANLIQPQEKIIASEVSAMNKKNYNFGRKQSNPLDYYTKRKFPKIILEESPSDSKPIRKTLTLPVSPIQLPEPQIQLDSISSHSDSIDQSEIKGLFLFLNIFMRTHMRHRKAEAFTCLKAVKPKTFCDDR